MTGKVGIAAALGLTGALSVWLLWPGGQHRADPAATATAPAAAPQVRGWPAFDALLGDDDAVTDPRPSARADATEEDPATAPALRGPALVEATLARLSFDEDGRLVVDKATGKALQDAFSRLNRPLTDAELEGVERMIRRRLSGPAADRVVGLVRDFHGYRQALEARARDGWGELSLRERLAERVALRRRHLGEDAAIRFYADQEAYQRFVLERQRIAERSDLSREQRVALQTALQDDLLAGVMHLEDRESAAARALRGEMRAMHEQDASQAFRDYVRTQAQGLAAASAAIEDPEARAAWERQLALYRSERRAILNAGLTESDKREQLQALLGRYFGGRVERLVEAYRAD